MRKKIGTILLFFMVSLLVVGGRTVNAKGESLTKINPDTKVLVVFSTEDWEMDENIRLLDLKIGHFSDTIEYKNVHDLEKNDIEDKTHLFYYGHIKEKLPPTVSEIISLFEGPILTIGYNTEQLGEKYSFLTVGEEMTISKMDYLGDKDKSREIGPHTIFEAVIDEGAEVLVQGDGEQGIFPVIMRNNKNYYLAADSFDQPYSTYFSQTLNVFFDVETSDKTPAYIRLEDVHPLSDAKRLKAAAEELAKRDIPYMVSTIPVYIDPTSGRRYHFEDQKEVLKVLRYMQDNGGTIVLHGYTHQFRESETGEGFEFWDVEHEMPIYHRPTDEVVKLTEKDFKDQDAYEAHMAKNKEFERKYIEERLTRGVQEMVNYGLYPLAFEAPHYTLSQHGYRVVSDFFSTYVGQIQLSDKEWEIMDTTPYATKPNILNGMLLLPETIGYVQPEEENAVKDMMKSADYYQVAEGGMIGAFYHPYLGLEGLQELLDEMEKIENIEWIDLKELDNKVVVENVTIQSRNGEITTEVKNLRLMSTSFDFLNYHIKETVVMFTWIIAVIGIVSVLMFTSFLFHLNISKKRIRVTDKE